MSAPLRWSGLARAALLAAYATTTKVVPLASRPARDAGCAISFLKDAKPSAAFETVGKIETHIAKNLFFGGERSSRTRATGSDAGTRDDRVKRRLTVMPPGVVNSPSFR